MKDEIDEGIFKNEPQPDTAEVETIDIKIENKFKKTFKNTIMGLFVLIVIANMFITVSLIINFSYSFILFALNTYYLLRFYKISRSVKK